jgi:hypothetical protein
MGDRKELKARHHIAKKLITLRTQLREKDKRIEELREKNELLKKGQQDSLNQLIELKERMRRLSTTGEDNKKDKKK